MPDRRLAGMLLSSLLGLAVAPSACAQAHPPGAPVPRWIYPAYPHTIGPYPAPGIGGRVQRPLRAYYPPRYPGVVMPPAISRPGRPARPDAPRTGAIPAAARLASPVPVAATKDLDRVPGTAARPAPASPDFSGDSAEFIDRLRPIIERENRRLLELRAEVLAWIGVLQQGGVLNHEPTRSLRKLSRRYRIDGDPIEDAASRERLVRRIDAIPVSLAVAQAASESAWGRSRFAREALNLFGIWTYDPSRGVVPGRREAGRQHLIRKFDSIEASVRYYMHTLNSHPAYAELRRLRQEQRLRGDELDGYQLADGLLAYSEKGEEYVRLIRSVMDSHDLRRHDRRNHDG